MKLIYDNYPQMDADSRTEDTLFDLQPLTKLFRVAARRRDWSWFHTDVLVRLWRTYVTLDPSMNDGTGISLPVAFAEVGWSNNWNYINGLGIRGVNANVTAYTGSLDWTLGNIAYKKEATVLTFRQSAVTLDA